MKTVTSVVPPWRELLFLLSILCFVSTAWSGEQSDDHQTFPATESVSEPKASTAKPSQQQGDTFEVFIPSEQISEDLPVPFPVDI